MTCALVSHLETASEPRKALWEGVETAVLENTKFKKDAFNRMVHDDFVRRNKSRMDDYIILNYLTHLINSIN